MGILFARLPFGPWQQRLDLSWITPDWAVGAAPPLPALYDTLREAGVTSIVDLRAEAALDPAVFERCSLQLFHLPVQEGQTFTYEQLLEGSSWVLSQIAAGQRVLICCQKGRGRSVTLACAVLLAMGYLLGQTLALVVARRRVANPSEGQLAALRGFAARLSLKAYI